MKRILLLTLAWLALESSYAQNDTKYFNQDSEPITKTGIQLPQLITIDLNRTTLQYSLNLSQGLSNPNLGVHFEKLISDAKKQFTFYGTAGLNHSISISDNDNRDFYTLNSMTTNFGADLKFFNDEDYFIQIGTQHNFNKIGGFSDWGFINHFNEVSLGMGVGRINYVNDGASALAIIDKLQKYGMMNRDLDEVEYLTLAQKIRDLKNRRKFVNRSYPLTEQEEIQELLISFGVLPEGINVIEIIDDVYRYEPIFERTSGKQLSIIGSGLYTHSDFLHEYNSFGLRANISFAIHTPINFRWQYNFKVNGYIHASNTISDFIDTEDRIKKVGVNMSNELHYLVDPQISYSVKATAGYDFINRRIELIGFGPFYNQDGYYINTSTKLKYQISRTMSTTFGIDFTLSSQNNYTGLNLGLNF